MRLVINGYDFAPFLLQDGVTQYEIRRQERSVVALDGLEYRAGISKRGMNVSLGLVPDGTYQAMLNALSVTPATVDYTDALHGRLIHIFHVSDPQGALKVCVGGVDYWSGITFTLEEK